jgi:hypothetical protein
MISQKKWRNVLVCNVVAFLLATIVLQGQVPHRVQKTLKIGKYVGEAKFGYTLVQGDTLLQGDFIMQRSNLLELLEGQDYSFLFKGQFNEGVPQGDWTFEFGEFQSNRASTIVDYQYRVLVNGTQKSAKGTINKGKPDGRWIILEEQIENSEIVQTIFKSEINFSNGIPERSFEISDEKNTLVGRFLRNGLAHDEWSLFPKNGMTQTESWYYREGLLLSITRSTDGQDHILPIFEKINAPQITTVNLDKRYLAILNFYTGLIDIKDISAYGLPKLLDQNTGYYQNIQKILSELGEASFRAEFKVNVPFFPISVADSALIAQICGNAKKAKEHGNAILDNSQLNILKLTNTEGLYLFNLAKTLIETYVNPMEQFGEYDSLGILPNLKPDKLLEGLWPKGIPASHNISISFDNDDNKVRHYVLPEIDQDNMANNDFYTIERISEQVVKALEGINRQLATMLAKDKRQNELLAIEDSLIGQQERLKHTVDSLRLQISNKFTPALDGIITVASHALGNYSNNSNAPNGLEMAKETLKCIGSLISLVETVGQMPQYAVEIKENYTDRVWNPFMATLMDEVLKKRIISAYEKELEPYFLNEIANGLSCEETPRLNAEIQRTYRRVMALRQAETIKLERKLKRAKNPEEILELIFDETLSKKTQP